MSVLDLLHSDLSTATKVRQLFRSLDIPDVGSPRPYVYMAFHKRTMDFYIGFRCAASVPPTEDLGIRYFTSCKKISCRPEDFYFAIIQVFRSKDRAYRMEQLLIKAHIQNKKCLNSHWQSSREFSMAGAKRPDLAEYNKKFKTLPRIEKHWTCLYCRKAFSTVHTIGANPKPRKYCSKSCSSFNTSPGRPSSNLGVYGRPPWNKGKSNPYAAENGRKGAAKLSASVKGRKMATRADGSRHWTYPSRSLTAKGRRSVRGF